MERRCREERSKERRGGVVVIIIVTGRERDRGKGGLRKRGGGRIAGQSESYTS